MNTTEIASELNTTPKTLRKFLRADLRERDIAIPGKGSRYSIERKELRGLKSRFSKWQIAESAKRANAKNADTDSE
jgi:predicted transcriptional regulator